MALTNRQLYDTRYRVNDKYIGIASTNARVNLLDVTTLVGHEVVSGNIGGQVNIAKISWTTDVLLQIIWNGTASGQDVVAFLCAAGSGTYGFMPGQPAINNNGVNTAATSGDVLITNASANFTLSIEYHKVQDAGGRGWTATG